MNSTKDPKKRIEWMDLAKGMCICLVVLGHVSMFYGQDSVIDSIAHNFRMPLYFILSGLFFKRYEGFCGFLKRKTNKLLIPYVFFFIVTGIFIPNLLHSLLGLKIWLYQPEGWMDLFHIFQKLPNGNPSIWFLFCLFEINVLFYCITMLVDRYFKGQSYLYGVIAFIMGIGGLCLSCMEIGLPSYLDTALTALPFFYFGWFLKNRTSFLYSSASYQNIIPTIAFLSVSLYAIYQWGKYPCGFMANVYGGVSGAIWIYPFGLLGSMCIFLISRLLLRLPFITYLGRYSIMVLVTHGYVIQFIDAIFRSINFDVEYKTQFNIILTLLCYLILIPLMKKFMPHVTVQKDVIVIS